MFQHRILGQIAFDTPFLGMHPGVVSTGIASLFKGAPDLPEPIVQDDASVAASISSGSSNPFNSQPEDPNYNPSYANDIHIPVRKNKFDRAWYFWNKHYGEVRQAAQRYVKSHLEFGGCLADYPGLRKRYDQIRPLEDIDSVKGRRDGQNRIIPRVRFVNYYTASTGRIKERPEEKPQEDAETEAKANAEVDAERGVAVEPSSEEGREMQELKSPTERNGPHSRSPSRTPRISLEEHRGDEVISKDLEDMDMNEEEMEEMQHIEPRASTPSPVRPVNTETSIERTDTAESQLSELPTIPPEPTAPPPFDPGSSPDPDALKIALKEYSKQVKAYEKAKKDREKAIRNQEKAIAKREKMAKKEQDKLAKQDRLEEQKLHKEKIKRQQTLNQEQYDQQLQREATERAAAQEQSGGQQQPPAPKKQRDRKFCTLPSKDSKTGERDPTWIRVYMQNMDEVVAHTSLFVVSDAYAMLVGDTAARIEDWIHQDATARAVLEDQKV